MYTTLGREHGKQLDGRRKPAYRFGSANQTPKNSSLIVALLSVVVSSTLLISYSQQMRGRIGGRD